MSPLIIIMTLLMLIMLASLIFAGFFLSKDKQKKNSKRALYALGIRVACAIGLFVLASYGIYTGELRSQAPWSYPQGQAYNPQQQSLPTQP